MQHAKVVRCTGYAHIISQCKAAVKGAGGNATVQIAVLSVACSFARRDVQGIFLYLNGKVFLCKSSHGD